MALKPEVFPKTAGVSRTKPETSLIAKAITETRVLPVAFVPEHLERTGRYGRGIVSWSTFRVYS
jgi:hypothetical protein